MRLEIGIHKQHAQVAVMDEAGGILKRGSR